MWKPVSTSHSRTTCRNSGYTRAPAIVATFKYFCNFRSLPFILLAFIFLSSINGASSHASLSHFYDASYNNLLDSRQKSNKQDFDTDFALCRRCGGDLADAKDIINHLSPDARVIANQTLFERKGIEVQILRNSFNIEFRVITTSKSKCVPVENWYTVDSWYPGYAWKPCICKNCRVHHGWLFEPIGAAQLNTNKLSNKAFFMLKLHNLISEKFANSLLVIPKSHTN